MEVKKPWTVTHAQGQITSLTESSTFPLSICHRWEGSATFSKQGVESGSMYTTL